REGMPSPSGGRKAKVSVEILLFLLSAAECLAYRARVPAQPAPTGEGSGRCLYPDSACSVSLPLAHRHTSSPRHAACILCTQYMSHSYHERQTRRPDSPTQTRRGFQGRCPVLCCPGSHAVCMPDAKVTRRGCSVRFSASDLPSEHVLYGVTQHGVTYCGGPHLPYPLGDTAAR